MNYEIMNIVTNVIVFVLVIISAVWLFKRRKKIF